MSGLIFLVPFIVWAWWRLGRGEKRGWIRPFAWYTVGFICGDELGVHAARGTRRAVSLFGSGVAVDDGFGGGGDWAGGGLVCCEVAPLAARASQATVFGDFCGIAFVLSLFVGLARGDADEQLAQIYEEIGEQLPPEAVVMVGDAPGFYYHTGVTAVSIPNEPIPVLLEAADQFSVGYLLLDAGHPQPLDALYLGEGESERIVLVEQYELTDAEGNVSVVNLYQIENE